MHLVGASDRQVSIHAPARGATAECEASDRCRHSFNPRARAGRDRMSCRHVIDGKQFQSTRPRGARPAATAMIGSRLWFQSTRPRGARLRSIVYAVRTPSCFNPRARAGRDVTASRRADARRSVSIHAPARGATTSCADEYRSISVSIHAPARGATRRRPDDAVDERVSIHAPARGATAVRAGALPATSRFNPRARAGRDALNGRDRIESATFQSTRPRGARPATESLTAQRHASFNPRARAGRDTALAAVASRSTCFNPRARAGRDAARGPRAWTHQHVSIHAPARGATGTLILRIWPTELVSIHAPARGATLDVSHATTRTYVFQSTRPRGARLGMSSTRLRSIASFNPRARAGRDADRIAGELHRLAGFNPRARAGRDAGLRSSLITIGDVSIHAPARGATGLARVMTRYRRIVSIHAPARGAT